MQRRYGLRHGKDPGRGEILSPTLGVRVKESEGIQPFAENIALTRQVVEYAHDHGVVVEAELGTLAGIEDEVNVSAEDSSYTRPEEVEEFVSKTGCDSLAIAIGIEVVSTNKHKCIF